MSNRHEDDCTYCGQNVPAGQFHDFGSCVLYKADHKQPLLAADRQYLVTLGLWTLRHDDKEARLEWQRRTA